MEKEREQRRGEEQREIRSVRFGSGLLVTEIKIRGAAPSRARREKANKARLLGL